MTVKELRNALDGFIKSYNCEDYTVHHEVDGIYEEVSCLEIDKFNKNQIKII